MELRKFLKENLSAKDFENVHLSLGITPTRRTQIFNHPERMKLNEIQQLVKLVNKQEYPLYYFINKLRCGTETISLAKAEELLINK